MTFFANSVTRSCQFCLIGFVTGIAGWLATPHESSATPIVVPNFSFEATAPNDGNFDAAPIPDWVITGDFSAAGAFNSTDSQFSGTTGGPLPSPGDANNFGLANLSRSTTAGSDFAVFTSAAPIATVQDNTQYSLTVAVGNRKGFAPDSITIEFLVDDSAVLASSLSVLGAAIPDDSFMDFTTSFTTLLEGDPLTGGDLKVRLTHSSLSGSGTATADFDNVRVELTELPPIPEPSTFTLGVLGLAAVRRFRRRVERHSRHAQV